MPPEHPITIADTLPMSIGNEYIYIPSKAVTSLLEASTIDGKWCGNFRTMAVEKNNIGNIPTQVYIIAMIVDFRIEGRKQSFMFSSEKSSIKRERVDAIINIRTWLYRKTRTC